VVVEAAPFDKEKNTHNYLNSFSPFFYMFFCFAITIKTYFKKGTFVKISLLFFY